MELLPCGCCLIDLACFVLGIVVMAMGKIKLTGDRGVQGGSARLIGALLMLPLLVGSGGAFIYGFTVGASIGLEREQQGKKGPITPEEIQAIQDKVQLPQTIIHIAGFALPLVLALAMTIILSRPLDNRKRRRDEDDDDDRPRRRRRDDDDDDDDDRPRSRRRDEDEDEEDDAPRRRRVDDEEPDDRIRGE